MSQVLKSRIEALLKIIQDYDVRYALAKKDATKAIKKGVYSKMDDTFDDLRIERAVSYLPAKKELHALYLTQELEIALLSNPKKALRDFILRDDLVTAVRNLETEGLITVEREPCAPIEVAKDVVKSYMGERSLFTENTPGHGYGGAICPSCTIHLNKTSTSSITEATKK